MSSSYAVLISARMTSERLPGKALVDYCGVPNLHQVVTRWRRSRRSPLIIVCTGDSRADDQIEESSAKLGVACYRAPQAWINERLVTDQMRDAVIRFAPNAAHIARGMVDNPLVDVALADWRLDILRESGADGLHYGGYEDKMTYAATTDVWARSAWDTIMADSSGSQLEHPGAYFWDNLSRFKAAFVPPPTREYLGPHRTELDTPEDLEMLRALWLEWLKLDVDVASYPCLPTLTALDILEYRPDISAINAHIIAKTQTRPTWAKGSGWKCQECDRRIGAIVAGDLMVYCPHCGEPRKYYSHKPEKRR